VAVAGGSEAGATLAGDDGAALTDGEELGDPKRQPPSSRAMRAEADGPRRRMRAA
jgi:hypothetical protein